MCGKGNAPAGRAFLPLVPAVPARSGAPALHCLRFTARAARSFRIPAKRWQITRDAQKRASRQMLPDRDIRIWLRKSLRGGTKSKQTP
jgi:hypothetical protein